MVAQQQTSRRYERCIPVIICLLCVFASSCVQQKQEATIVKLQFIEAKDALATISQTLPAEIEYSISGNTIVFLSSEANLTPTINILKALDQPPTEYELHIRPTRHHNNKHYSTKKQTHFPMQSLRISENQPAKLETSKTIFYPFFDQATELKLSEFEVTLTKLNTLNSKLTLNAISTQKGVQQRHSTNWTIPHNRWQTLSPKLHTSTKQYSTGNQTDLDIEIKVNLISP